MAGGGAAPGRSVTGRALDVLGAFDSGAPRLTLSEIAEWWFGSSAERFWRRIWLANRRTIGPNPNLIRSSQWLRLPFSGFNYHVERGDTLSQLAQWVYGDGNQWERIHDANPWIQDPDQIQASWWICNL